MELGLKSPNGPNDRTVFLAISQPSYLPPIQVIHCRHKRILTNHAVLRDENIILTVVQDVR